jgi:hypothetical protein
MTTKMVLKPALLYFAFCWQINGAFAFELDNVARYGMTIRTHALDSSLADNEIYIKYSGPVAFPMVENLMDIWALSKNSVQKIIFEIESPGGDVAVARRVVSLFGGIKETAELTTRVGPGKVCASACVALFMQGTIRQASGASAFMFHGVCPPFSNVPKQEPTERFLDMLRRSGTSEKFLNELSACGYFSAPGEFWISGYELYYSSEANIITDLLPAWTPAKAVAPPFDTQMTPR